MNDEPWTTDAKGYDYVPDPRRRPPTKLVDMADELNAARIAQETPGRLCGCGKLWEKHTMKERRECRAEYNRWYW